MPILIEGPSIIEAAGNKPKIIEEFAGRVNSGDEGAGRARKTSPPGGEEPGAEARVSGDNRRPRRRAQGRARRRYYRGRGGAGGDNVSRGVG